MRTSAFTLGMLLTVAAGRIAFAAEPKEKQAEDAKEESVVAYDNKTNGALQVKSISDKPTDWFDVLQNGKRAIEGNPPRLNSTIELPPGTYVVDVNRTQRKVTIEAGKKVILLTGDLVVEGKPPGAFWYPMQGKERKLVANPPVLNSSRAFFAGTYTVFVHASVTERDKNLGQAEVKAGKKTVLKY